MAKLLKGAPVAEVIIKQAREIICEHMLTPVLAIVRAGASADAISYEQNIQRQAKKAGVEVQVFAHDKTVSQEILLSKINELNRDQAIHGIIINYPLPAQIDETSIRKTLLPQKDIDGITPASLATVMVDTSLSAPTNVHPGPAGSSLEIFPCMGSHTNASELNPSGFPPCTAEACMEILHYYNIDPSGKKVTVLGRSLTVGKPVAVMAIAKHATVTLCHSKTLLQDLISACCQADILITAIGKPKAVGPDHISSGQTIIDVGINLDQTGSLCGDVDFSSVSGLVDQITPVPGGVGIVTTALLIKHTAQAAVQLK